MASKESELALLRNQAAEKERVQEERIKKLEELVTQQSLQNQKLQSMLDSQLSQPPPVQVVETATLTRTVDPFVRSATIPITGGGYAPTSAVPSVDSPIAEPPIAPPHMHPPDLSGPCESNIDGDAAEIAMNRIPHDGINIAYCKAVGGVSGSGPPFTMPPNLGNTWEYYSNVTRTVPYGVTDRRPDKSGGGGDGPGDGDDGDGNGNGGNGRGEGMMIHLYRLRYRWCRPLTRRKRAFFLLAPGGGDGRGDDDPDKDSNDSDEKFVRRIYMKKFLGGGFNVGGSDDK